MTKLSDGAKWLKADELQSGETAKIKNEGEWVTSTKFSYPDGNPQQQYVIEVECLGNTYRMNLNKSNRLNCIKAWGCETKDWIGHKMKLNILIALVSGKKRNVIEVEPLNAIKPVESGESGESEESGETMIEEEQF